MASIGRRIRKLCGRVRKFITNADMKTDVVPYYDGLNEIEFWEDIVGRKQVQLIGKRYYSESLTDITSYIDPQKENLVEVLSINEDSKSEIIRDNIDWSIVDGMQGDFAYKFPRNVAKKPTVCERLLQQFAHSKESPHKETTMEFVEADKKDSIVEPFEFVGNLQSPFEEISNEFKQSLEKALSIDVLSFLKELLQLTEDHFETILPEDIKRDERNMPTEYLDQNDDTDVRKLIFKLDEE
ncbi:hypothetical protein JTE90_003647 [Oedothorax gibbosus]|uniref:Uncharacterized protein n=1 Tax=Oedothorax gibbosus TaxID=931172 RepID=A0AAV6THH8_9ARAC|nr:hypothetical protein JTE90_003647 [Oedothorax gibbosus]